MKMLSFGCKSLREGVTTAIVFSIAGVLLILTAIFIVPEIAYLPHLILLSGSVLLLFVPVIIVATILKNRKH